MPNSCCIQHTYQHITAMERQNGGSNAGGFDFELVKRNSMLAAKGMKPPSAWKTGTTIAGVIYKVC